MARITEATRELLRKKILEKSQDKRDALAGDIQKLSDCIRAADEKMKAKAVALIKEEFDTFNENVAHILKSHGLKFANSYSAVPYTVDNLIESNSGKAFIKRCAADVLEATHDSGDRAYKLLADKRADLEKLDAKRCKACEDIELRVALGAKFDEVVELINNLQF